MSDLKVCPLLLNICSNLWHQTCKNVVTFNLKICPTLKIKCCLRFSKHLSTKNEYYVISRLLQIRNEVISLHLSQKLTMVGAIIFYRLEYSYRVVKEFVTKADVILG